ncbi:hypothetical protein Cri9333_1741 [Crinalium epipsammum PCC 9333]|uniref:Uncharacterized protein n=1 Tax=Crinalium epipsammum PCC 9333 TaxID=1173022 RepID=K9VXE4_9CYAN|nr:hypothetical protein [Crinalium epipsammum]AFZ12626.1 hypothetical protein Cri9333_1741 [Crinalium epipsammum PCC 9333]
MTRIDQGNWSVIHDQLHFVQPNQAVSVVLNFPTDKLIVTLNNLTVAANWIKAGSVEQEWNRLLVPVLLMRKTLSLSTPTLVYLEPVATSTLRFKTVNWLTDIGITIEAFTP